MNQFLAQLQINKAKYRQNVCTSGLNIVKLNIYAVIHTVSGSLRFLFHQTQNLKRWVDFKPYYSVEKPCETIDKSNKQHYAAPKGYIMGFSYRMIYFDHIRYAIGCILNSAMIIISKWISE